MLLYFDGQAVCLVFSVNSVTQYTKTGATSEAGTTYSCGAPAFIPGFKWGSCYSIFSFICMFCRLLFVRL